MSGPAGYVSTHAATSFAVTVTALQGAGGTTLKLETRTLGSAADWTTQASDASPAVGDVLTASGLTEDASLEWRLIETSGATTYDGTHGITTPCSSLWATLAETVATAIEGQGLDSDAIYIGIQPEANPPPVCAVLRTMPEKVTDRANTAERVEFPVEVEIRVIVADDQGDDQKTLVELWQRRIESALHEKHAGDFPGIAGLEEVRVEIATKDGRAGGPDALEDEMRARAVVRFAVWRAK